MAALADYGTLKIAASSDGGTLFGYAEVGATFTDSFLIEAEGQTGNKGFARIQIDFDWLLTAVANEGGATSHVQANVSFGGGSIGIYETLYNCGTLACSPAPTGLRFEFSAPGQSDVNSMITDSYAWADLPFTFGEAFNISMTFNAITQAEGVNGPHAQASVDGFHSVYWGGISNIVDKQGNEVKAQLTSGSGTDYSDSFKPQVGVVPEPETYALILLGLGLMGAVTRRRKQTES